MVLDPKVKEASELASKTLSLPARLVASWWVAENGWDWPLTNNVGNISYQGEGVPSTGVFEGVTRVNDNNTVDYKDMASGVEAFCRLVSTPKSEKALTLDLSDLHACGDDVHEMTVKIGESNWASSHYNPSGQGAGSSIWNVFNSPSMVEAFKDTPVAPESHPAIKHEAPVTKAAHKVITVKEGDTLSKIARDYHTTVLALAELNGLEDPNKIDKGESLRIPNIYKVKSGDVLSRIAPKVGTDVSTIAKMNKINPNHIEVGWALFV